MAAVTTLCICMTSSEHCAGDPWGFVCFFCLTLVSSFTRYARNADKMNGVYSAVG